MKTKIESREDVVQLDSESMRGTNADKRARRRVSGRTSTIHENDRSMCQVLVHEQKHMTDEKKTNVNCIHLVHDEKKSIAAERGRRGRHSGRQRTQEGLERRQQVAHET